MGRHSIVSLVIGIQRAASETDSSRKHEQVLVNLCILGPFDFIWSDYAIIVRLKLSCNITVIFVIYGKILYKV